MKFETRKKLRVVYLSAAGIALTEVLFGINGERWPGVPILVVAISLQFIILALILGNQQT
jgi:hypothetical protein